MYKQELKELTEAAFESKIILLEKSINATYQIDIHLRHGTSLHGNFRYQVSKNDDEKRCFNLIII